MSEARELVPSQTMELLDEVVLGSARGAGRKSMLEVEVVRALTIEDLPALAQPAEVGVPNNAIVNIRANHHKLAMVIAEGHDQEIVSLMTGYSPAYISKLKNDPAFAELMAYYQGMKEQVFVDTAERMRVLGLSTLDELQARLETEGEKWSKRDLMDLAELMLGKGGGRALGGLGGSGEGQGPAGNAVTVNVSFVGGPAQASGPLIEAQAQPGESSK